jgi:SAM-dependent methyltransferase
VSFVLARLKFSSQPSTLDALKLKTSNSQLNPPPCDLCGLTSAQFVLATPRLDGPLVRCLHCGLCYVLVPEPSRVAAATDGSVFAATETNGESREAAGEMQRLAARARELALVEPEVEEREGRWRELTAAERLTDLRRFVRSGHLLEVGCATGEMLAAARSSFTVTGVEVDSASSAAARARGLGCFSGTLLDARFPAEHFDAAALYHVIEHFPSPRLTLGELRRIVRPGGWLVIETPNIATPWFRLLGARWRQFIPDHRYFFTPETITRLCAENGFEVRELRAVGKAMSLRLFISRLGRYSRTLAQAAGALSQRLNLDDRTLRLNLGDVMRVYARRGAG